MLRGHFKDAADYANNVSDSEWEYDSDNFSTYGPGYDVATLGGLIEIKNLSDHKKFIYHHRETYNKRREEDDNEEARQHTTPYQ
jgi:hypothetical protein